MNNQFGKKVFFLYPHSVIKSDLVHELIMNEYEIYTLFDHRKFKLILRKYPDSIIFINIDDNLPEAEWFDFIKNIMTDPDYSSIRVGILTYNENTDLAEKYLMDLTVPCGFIQLKLGKEDSKNIILNTLIANECKGDRKYIRATSDNILKSTFNVKVASDLKTGVINDISSVGMSCYFDEEIVLKKNAFLPKMQLKLNGKLVLIDAIVFGSRDMGDKKKLMVLMFTNNMTDDSKSKIHKYIGEVLQSNIEKEIKEIYTK